jgi:hypothetical protein
MMHRELSSGITPFFRWVIPALLSIAAIVVIWRIGGVGMPGGPGSWSLTLAIVIATLLVVLARIFDRAKRVWIDAGTLIVSDYRTEVHVKLDEITSVEMTPYMKPDRVRVHFCRATKFGDSVVFFPPIRGFNILLRSPVAAELKQLAAAARESDNTLI